MKYNQTSEGESSDPQLLVRGRTPDIDSFGKPSFNRVGSPLANRESSPLVNRERSPLVNKAPPTLQVSNEDEGIEDTVQEAKELKEASQRPLPTETGDGTYVEEETNGSTLWQDLRHLGIKDVNTLASLIKTEATGQPIDDKTMLMEHVMQLVSKFPEGSKTGEKLTNVFLNELWTSLPHPPLSYVGEKYAYRSADGSYNNPAMPQLGAANTEYARTIAPRTVRPSNLPDPGLVFDSVFARDEFHPHPNKVSSMFFIWASLVIHDIFQTGHPNQHINKTSSYLDLAILYGDTQEEQNKIRTFQDGKLKPDCFSEIRLQALPPASCVILVMLNRYHNHVVEQLAIINENNRFTKPQTAHMSPDQARMAWLKYDNDLFQTGRLITTSLYMNITLYDYLRTIINLNRTNSTWCLDPRAQSEDQKPIPSGLGNQCSVEFNLAYRWHSAISYKDEKWAEKVYKEIVGKDGEEASVADLLGSMRKFAVNLEQDPMKRTFGGLQRQADGTYRDEDLVQILTSATEEVAGSFGARNVPKVLRAVEMMGIEQGRRWNVGSLNELRKFFKLKPYQTFEEINSDPSVADALRHLYDHPDNVELYPGLVAEEAKEPMVPGVGIAPTYTISRVVLSDAVALVRGDRFYTLDYNSKNLTNWGFSESQFDLGVNQGCLFYKLVARALPDWYKPDSIYAHYPMTIPSENKKIMRTLGREDDYSWDRPSYKPPGTNVCAYANVRSILDDPTNFRVTWADAMGSIFGKPGLDFMLSGDSRVHSDQRVAMASALYRQQWQDQVKSFYLNITEQLLKERSYKLGKVYQVDLTRDIGNIAHVRFASDMFSLPLKTEKNPRGIFTEHEMYSLMSTIFTSIFFDNNPPESFALRRDARAAAQKLGQVVEAIVKSTGASGLMSSLVDSFRSNGNSVLNDYGVHMIRRLLDSGLDVTETTWSQILPTAVAMVANQAQVFTQIMDFYLSPAGAQHLPIIHRLAKQDSDAADEKLLRYCMEGIRLHGTFNFYRESRTSAVFNDRGGRVQITPGSTVLLNIVEASRDPDAFPDPDEVRLDRPMSSYIHYGEGSHMCLGREANKIAMTAMMRVVGRLENLRRAPGPQGELKKVPGPNGGYSYLSEDGSRLSPLPSTFKVHFDGPA
ncbi:heme peroxidase [Aspergillus ambiguus]|uniref:peroxidase/cytochrome P450 family protein n=1 Tax=Aspergillus ambiguus TaxID=176160 RepID=UPI003CCE465C